MTSHDGSGTSRSFDIPPLYPITAPRPGAGHATQVEQFLIGGARLVQVRDKTASDETLTGVLVQCRRLCHRFEATLILNDRVELAAKLGLDGVHLGQTDMPPAQARNILGGTAVLGLSVHNRQQFRQALSQPVDYIAVGPVFCTTSKLDADPVVELPRVNRWVQQADRPIVAIGGINLGRACEIWESGVSCVAVISDILNADEPAKRVREYLEHAERIRV